MSRIPTPSSIATSPAASQPLLEAVNKQLGSVPNLFRVVGNSPAALEGYLAMSGALAKGALPSDRVLRFLDEAGVMKRETRNNPEKAKPKKKAQERTAANEKAAATAAAAPAAEAPAAS